MERSPLSPAINVFLVPGGAWLAALLPGVHPEDLDLRVSGNNIALAGNRRPAAPEGAVHQLRECPEGPFHRALALPFEVDPERTQARMAGGLLRIGLWGQPDGGLEAPPGPSPCPALPPDDSQTPDWPAADIYETAETVALRMDVPGCVPEGPEVTVDRGLLALEARMVGTPETTEMAGTEWLREFWARSWRRSFRLPPGVGVSGAEACLAHGVVTVTLPKK